MILAVMFKDEIEQRRRYGRVAGELVLVVYSQECYGRWKNQQGKWQSKKLYRDKLLSCRRWPEFQKEMEARDAGAK